MPSYREAQPPGLEITAELRTWETPHKCPRCFCEIYAGEKDGFRIEACGRCGGVWLSPDVAKRALATGSRAPEELAKTVEQRTLRVVIDDSSALACPECAEAMSRARFGETVFDSCGTHGTWFDRNELRAAMAIMRGEVPDPAKTADERALEAMRAPFGTELQQLSRTLSVVLDALGPLLRQL